MNLHHYTDSIEAEVSVDYCSDATDFNYCEETVNLNELNSTDIRSRAVVLSCTDAEIHLDREYIALEQGESATLTADFNPDELNDYIVWESGNDEIAAVDQNGCVSAISEGTAIITAKVLTGSGEISARCRVDVTEQTVSDTVSEVSLAENKVTAELFSTDYTKVDVLLEMEQLLNPENEGNRERNEASNNGVAIRNASFTDDATADMFNLRVIDDRTLEIIPTEEALNAPNTVAKSYMSAVKINVGGRDFTTDALTLTVKKTVPKLKATAVKFNTYNAEDTRYIAITGGNVTDLSAKTVLPSWMQYNANMSLSVIDAVPAKASGKITFNATVEGFAGTYPVTVSYSTVSTAPKLAFSSSSITLLQKVYGFAEVSVKKITPPEFENSTVTLASIKEGTRNITDDNILVCSGTPDENGIIHIEWGDNAPIDGLAHTYKVFYDIEGKQFGFTVKSPKFAEPSMALKTTGTIECNLDGSYVKVEPAIKNLNSGSTYSIDEWYISDKDGNEAGDVSFILEKGKTDCTVKANSENMPGAGTYYVTAKAQTPVSYIYSTTKFTVKNTAAAKLKASAAIKASGSIDVIRPDTFVTVTPTVKNLYMYTLDENSLVIGTMLNKKFTPMEEAPFDVTYEDGVFTVKAAEGASHTVKYYAVLKVNDGLESKSIALPVKMGSAKFTANVKEVSLLAKDRYSSANVKLSTTDATLSAIDRVELDTASLKFFKLTDLGHGTYAISYKDNLIPSGLKASNTVKLNVFLDGNTTSKPNSMLSVKVTIK